MPIGLMYITDRTDVAAVAESVGVDRIFVDMEYIGKDERQAGMDTVKSYHTIEDVKRIRTVIIKSELMVRVNPINDKNNDFIGSETEINAVISAGADCIMLPMFKTAEEVERFVKIINGRAKTVLLIETCEAVENIESILRVEGIDEVHIGLNDLHLAYGKKFMFELLADNTVEKLLNKIKPYNIPYGFGGIARLGHGMLPAEYVLSEHYRLGSTRAILSRAFCNINKITDINEIKTLFESEISRIRKYEEKLAKYTLDDYRKNKEKVKELVQHIVSHI